MYLLQGFRSPHINIVDINVAKRFVVVGSTLSTKELLQKLESSRMKEVVKGLDDIALLEAGKSDVVTFVQLPSSCIVDGTRTVDGSEPGEYRLTVNENSDISPECERCGDKFNRIEKCMGLKRNKYNDLADIQVKSNGR